MNAKESKASLNFTKQDLFNAIKEYQLKTIKENRCRHKGDYLYERGSSVCLWWLGQFDAAKKRRLAWKLHEEGLIFLEGIYGRTEGEPLTAYVIGIKDEVAQ